MISASFSVAVVGAGQMGAGIAQVAAQSGHPVCLFDSSFGSSFASGASDGGSEARVRAGIEKSLAKLAEKKVFTESPDVIFKRIQFVSDLAAVAKTKPNIFIEAISENFKIKSSLFSEADKILPPECIFASNTSSISITSLAACTRRPERFVGMHFMNPVPLMKLVELIPGLATSKESFATVKELAEKFGKTTIVSKDFPGFVVNRILMPMINESVYALQEGLATREDIDAGMKLGTNQPMGPLTLADFIGLDTCLSIMEVLFEGFGDTKYRPAPLLRQYVQAGWLGKKSKRGFYSYE